MMGEYLAHHPAFKPPDGVLVAQIPLEHGEAGFRSRPVRKALDASGMTPELAAHLLLEFSSLRFAYEEDQFTRGRRGRKTEHVIARERKAGETPITVYEIDYHPAAAKFATTVDHVFTDTWEFILGLKGYGYLQVVPTREFGGKIIPSNTHTRNICIEPGTLIVLPPNIQANRWEDLGSQYENHRPHFRARYFTFPKSYGDAATRQLDLTHASNPWDYIFLRK